MPVGRGAKPSARWMASCRARSSAASRSVLPRASACWATRAEGLATHCDPALRATGHREYAAAQRALFLQVGKQAALNLTTIDFEHADDDVKRILDSATDAFYDDFSRRSQPFVDVVKQAKSKSTGEIAAAGLESDDKDSAQVLVAVTVKTSNAGAPEQAPRAWRMRASARSGYWRSSCNTQPGLRHLFRQ